MKHSIQALVENKFGVLARVASLFSARGYNIDSLTVGETQDSAISCMTIVVHAADDRVLEQIKNQLAKLIDVITVIDFTHREYIDRELFLLKVLKTKENKGLLESFVQTYPVRIIHESAKEVFWEVCVDRHQVDQALHDLQKIGIKELVRSGKIALGK